MLIHGGTDQQRPLERLRRGRRVLDELDELVAEHDLAGRRRDVDAELERLGVGHRDLELAVAALDVVEQVVEPLDEVLATGGHGGAEHLGIGQREVRRRERVDVLARVEVDLLLRLLVEALDACDLVVQPARGDQVALLDVVEQEVLLPVLVLEALVALRRGRHRSRRRAHHLHERGLPQAHVVPPQVHLRLGEPHRIGHHLRCELEERLPDAELVGHHRVAGRPTGAGRSRRSASRSSPRRRRGSRRARPDRRSRADRPRFFRRGWTLRMQWPWMPRWMRVQ